MGCRPAAKPPGPPRSCCVGVGSVQPLVTLELLDVEEARGPPEGVEDHPDYHKPTDDFANIMPEFYVRAVETILNTVRLLDRKFDNH